MAEQVVVQPSHPRRPGDASEPDQRQAHDVRSHPGQHRDTGVEGRYGEARVSYLGRKELVANKRATARKRDLADLEAIGEP